MGETVTTLSGFPRRIPATMATQHPDNASGPPWSDRRDARITLEMEGEEAYRNFCLGSEETMWDNEGKHADYGIGLKLVETYEDYFRERQLGRDVHITYRIPNRWKQKGSVHRHVCTAITAENETLRDFGFHAIAFFEIILPFTEDAFQLLGAQVDYVTNNGGRRVPEYLELIPLIEGPSRLGELQQILAGYVEGMKRIWNLDVSYVRPFAARSDPAMDSGIVAAELFVLGALSEFTAFSRTHSIPVYPILGAGSASFRGGLTPASAASFAERYPGYRTVTVQSAFRYDYPEDEVRAALQLLNERLPQSEARELTDPELAAIHELMTIFTTPYKATLTSREGNRMPVADTIIEIADRYIPSHRERSGHVGVFGYSRSVGGAEGADLPRAIKYVASFMSLGIPPDLIGVGRGLRAARELGLLPTLEALLPSLKDTLESALHLLDTEALAFLAKTSEAWRSIEEDVREVSEYTGCSAGPRTAADARHVTHTRNFFDLYQRFDGTEEVAGEMTEEALKAARIRRYLG
jgi:phosphoenolpyruvate carboxylase